MSLNEQLEQMRQVSWGRFPPEKRAILEGGTGFLAQSGIVDRIVKVGEKAPEFTLTSASGEQVSLSRLLQSGSVVLAFYRGHW